MTRYIGVVPVAAVEETTKKLLAVHPHADGTLNVGLSATGKEPATHYWFSWEMEPAVALKFMDKTKDVRKDAATPTVETAAKEKFKADVATAVKDGKKPPDPPVESAVTLYDSGKWTPDDVLKLTELKRIGGGG